jgi:hypothetical protein
MKSNGKSSPEKDGVKKGSGGRIPGFGKIYGTVAGSETGIGSVSSGRSLLVTVAIGIS